MAGRPSKDRQSGIVAAMDVQDASRPPWGRRLLTILLMAAVVGLPVNDLVSYGLLLTAAVLVFTGRISSQPRHWLAAAAVAALAIAAHFAWPLPRIEEGHNIVLAGRSGDALKAALPRGAHEILEAEFRKQYPPEHWCDPATVPCWRNTTPLPAFAFSADGLYTRPLWSRRPTGIDFANGMALRLGFVNDIRFDWGERKGDVQRAMRDRRSLAFLDRWKLTLPYFVMYRLPVEHTGATLCWRGTVLWEGADAAVSVIRHPATACRIVQRDDIGRRVMGVAIDLSTPLAMTLHPTGTVRAQKLFHAALILFGVAGIFLCLVRWRSRHALPAFALVATVLAYVVAVDVTMLGWLRAFEGGDDGLYHLGYGRLILQALAQGDIPRALEGGEPVYFFVPGLRYFRALEQVLFGDTLLGYLSVLIAMPFVLLAAARRFLPDRWAIAFLLIFMATPIGVLFGTNFAHHARWAVSGFGEPLAATLFLGGLALLIAVHRERARDASAGAIFCGGLLLALAVFIRPNLALMGGVILAGAGIILLRQARIRHAAALAAGFSPIALMPLHNWVFGNALVLFTRGETTYNFAAAPSAYPRALRELVTLDFNGGNLAVVARQLRWLLSGPSELAIMIPVHVAALVILVRITLASRFDGWLRIVALATFVQYGIGLFYQRYDRYHLLTWLLTALVVMVWLREEGAALFARHWPNAARTIARHPLIVRSIRWIDRGLVRPAARLPP
jgi:hypothetical protein